MKTLDKLLTSILAVTLVFSVLSVANPYYFVVGPSAYAENDDEEKSNSDHGRNAAHDSDKEEHDDNDECNPEDDVGEEAEQEGVNDDTEDETSAEEETDDDSESHDSDEETSSDVNDDEETNGQEEEDDVGEHEEESSEEENEVGDESEQDESEDEAEDNDDGSQDTDDAEETDEEQNDGDDQVEEHEKENEVADEQESDDECNNQGRSEDEQEVTDEEIKEKQKERRQHIVESITGVQIHQRHLNAEPMSVGDYAPGLAYSLTAAGVADHGGVHTVEVDMDIAVWKSNSAVVLMDVLGGTVTVEGHAYTVVIGYGLYNTHSDMMRVGALVVDEGTGDVFKLKLRGNAIGEDVQLPMNAGEALDLSFVGNSGPSKNEFAGAELDLEGTIAAT
jgi:hypothetical protein